MNSLRIGVLIGCSVFVGFVFNPNRYGDIGKNQSSWGVPWVFLFIVGGK